jgi:hypothetical protein
VFSLFGVILVSGCTPPELEADKNLKAQIIGKWEVPLFPEKRFTSMTDYAADGSLTLQHIDIGSDRKGKLTVTTGEWFVVEGQLKHRFDFENGKPKPGGTAFLTLRIQRLDDGLMTAVDDVNKITVMQQRDRGAFEQVKAQLTIE